MHQVLRLINGAELTDEDRHEAPRAQPVYVDIDNWEPERTRAPLAIAAQYSPTDKRRGRTLAYFEVCALPDEMPSDRVHFFGRVRAASAQDDGCLGLAKTWLDKCISGHAKCGVAALSTVLPTRCRGVARYEGTVYLVRGSEQIGP
nr:hypothetical protein B0A51_13452 [Rachicladosporium sp. CCFEE 5018]